MGFKRPFDDEEFQELPFKHPRQFDYPNKLTQFVEVVPFRNALPKLGVSVEDNGIFYKSHEQDESEDDTVDEDSNIGTRAPLSWVTGTSAEDAKTAVTNPASASQEHLELGFPRRTFRPFEDGYSLLMDLSPRRKIPIGPNHQATIPLFDGRHTKGESKVDGSHASNLTCTVNNEDEEKLIGACVIQMPDSSLSGVNDDNVGEGRKGCICFDAGSVRCVQQHILEARKNLTSTIEYEKFVNLGFCEMGEEVAHKWSEEEEELFHEVVYSNPLSLGQNFWKHLAAAFPCRGRKELVSYYFNVFMLRRRAAQNRSNLLDIDSDDDEWHGSRGDCFEVQVPEEDEDSAIESPLHEIIGAHPTFEDNDEEEDSDDDGDDDGGDDENEDDDDENNDGCAGDVGDYSGGASGADCGIGNSSESGIVRLSYDGGLDPAIQHADEISGSIEENFNVQDDSCMSFEFEPNIVNSCVLVDAARTAVRESSVKTDLSPCSRNKLDGCNDLVGQMYLFDHCDAKVWDGRYPTGPIKGVDFLPTCNIIEEIFGQDSWDNKKTRND